MFEWIKDWFIARRKRKLAIERKKQYCIKLMNKTIDENRDKFREYCNDMLSNLSEEEKLKILDALKPSGVLKPEERRYYLYPELAEDDPGCPWEGNEPWIKDNPSEFNTKIWGKREENKKEKTCLKD